jgi:hypothetical protein
VNLAKKGKDRLNSKSGNNRDYFAQPLTTGLQPPEKLFQDSKTHWFSKLEQF